ncbi:CRISPR-associated helicase/endonuclease Cas3 [Deinococcus planocerae]|uniref:CRISPR-associated helicase/endonuclease Cas3 n=1 Tax=Deinococcus planocerae TaxID=1737569 RepID=UPI000C7EA114|nr:CRISPR-associated helicase/endonuclease Cas3 [Deinococcus planocerae]
MSADLPPLGPAARSLWAKSDRGARPGQWLPVLHHLLDVAACAWEVLAREPARTGDLLAGDLGVDAELARRWTCALAGLHDLGKASPAFQQLWDAGAARVRVHLRVPTTQPAVPHGVVTQERLGGLLPLACGWPADLARHVGDAVGCHHGRRADPGHLSDRDHGGAEWVGVQLELVDAVFAAFGLLDAPPPPVEALTGAAFMRLAGLTSFADWVGSSFPLPDRVDELAFTDPGAYLERARSRARAALDDIGWTTREPLRPDLPDLGTAFAYIGGFGARSLQTLLAGQVAQGADDPRPLLALVEAPMGEGKTEAALYAFLGLQNALGHRGLYVALPTQATGNAMYDRLLKFLDWQLRGQARTVTVDLQLLHGGAELHARHGERRARTRTLRQQRLTTHPNAPGDPAEADAFRVTAEGWFAHRKRALLSEYGVGTVDQALLGVLAVPHQFVRLWGLGNRVVVLDEVHAYDTYTTRLIHALVAWLRALGSSVIVMSATLPRETRLDLLKAWGTPESGEAEYPRLTLARAGETRAATHHVPGPRRELNVRLQPLDPNPSAVARQAVDLASVGGCVAVIVNTVQRAQDVFVAVRDLLGDRCQTVRRGSKHPERVGVHLFHARYPVAERADREERVLRYLGPQPATYRRGDEEITGEVRPARFILIATQVAEQSLDFDADVMVSDLAPVDLLLQRAGRLHRHAGNTRRRGPHSPATLHVAGLGEWPGAALGEHRWKYVYAPALLYRTWHALRGREWLRLPDDLDPLVQGVYACPPLDGLTPEQTATLAAADADLTSRTTNEATLGGGAHLGLPGDFLSRSPTAPQADPDGEPPQDDDHAEDAPQLGTRLGERSVRIVLLHRRDGSVWLDADGREKPCLHNLRKDDWDTARRIYERSLQVTRPDIVSGIEAHVSTNGLRLGGEHQGWAAHPLLRGCLPLVLTGGEATLGRTRVRLDDELGVVYERVG